MPFQEILPAYQMHYLDPNLSGRETVLLLHGLGVTAESWGFQIPALVEAGYRVIIPDGRGFGKSGCPRGGHTIQEMAEDFAILLNRLQIKSSHVVGISMGGTHALQLALDHPESVNKLVLVNTFASFHLDKPSTLIYFAFRFLLIHLLGLPVQAKAVAQHLFPDPDQEELRRIMIDQICQANPGGYRATMRALARFNVVRRLGEIHQPTLVITGDKDSTVPPENQKVLVDKITNAQQVIIANAGHAVIADQPNEFNRVLIGFLQT